MNSKQLDKRLEKRIEEIETKIDALKDDLDQQNNPEVNNEIKSSLNRLNKLSNEINCIYRNLANKEFTEQLKLEQFENNIFNVFNRLTMHTGDQDHSL